MVKRVLQFLVGLKLCILSLLPLGVAGGVLGDAVKYHLLYALIYVSEGWMSDKVWADVWGSLPGVVFAYMLLCATVLLVRLGVRLMFRCVLSRVRFYWSAAVLWLGCLTSEVLFAAENRAGMMGCGAAGWCVFALTLALLVWLCLRGRSSAAKKSQYPGGEHGQ